MWCSALLSGGIAVTAFLEEFRLKLEDIKKIAFIRAHGVPPASTHLSRCPKRASVMPLTSVCEGGRARLLKSVEEIVA
jgi:hypothetical protein